MNGKSAAACAGAVLLGAAALQAGRLQVTSNFPDGLAQPGKTVEFQICYAGKPEKEKQIRVRLFFNGLKLREKIFPVSTTEMTEKESCRKPGWIAVTAELLDETGKPISPPQLDPEAGCGVMISPEQLLPSRPRPDDFDSYWKKAIQELRSIPVKAVRLPVKWDSEIHEHVICEDLQLNSWGDVPVSGYLLRPENAAPKSLPAILYFHGAGITGAAIQPEFADRAIVLDVNAHGMPNGKESGYYRAIQNADGRDRVFRNREDRDSAYLKGMFLRVVRSLDYVRSLPEWNGKDLIVFGRSQGGAQALVAAALVPEVTLCIANVPALGDHGGFAVGRRPGWPLLNTLFPEEKIDPVLLAATSDYFDVVNFTPLIRCPVRMSAGLIDFTCPPTSICVAYHQLPTEFRRGIQFFPTLGHAAPTQDADGREEIRKELKK